MENSNTGCVGKVLGLQICEKNKTTDESFWRSGIWGIQIWQQETPQTFLRQPKRCKLQFQAQFVFFTFGHNCFKAQFLAKKTNQDRQLFLHKMPKSGVLTRLWPKVKKTEQRSANEAGPTLRTGLFDPFLGQNNQKTNMTKLSEHSPLIYSYGQNIFWQSGPWANS